MKHTTIILFLLLSVVVFLGAETAGAATTFICTETENPLIGSSGILDQLYGVGNLLRIDDDRDPFWFPANGYATAMAKYSDFSQNFGYIPDLNKDGIFDESFVSLFDVPGGTDGVGLGGPSASLSSGNVTFLWALDPSGAPLWTSWPDLNSDSLDHMVTWYITGGASAGNYVLAWEEMPYGDDCDFNDFVVEVGFRPVPIPPAILLLGSGWIAMIGVRRKLKY